MSTTATLNLNPANANYVEPTATPPTGQPDVPDIVIPPLPSVMSDLEYLQLYQQVGSIEKFALHLGIHRTKATIIIRAAQRSNPEVASELDPRKAFAVLGANNGSGVAYNNFPDAAARKLHTQGWNDTQIGKELGVSTHRVKSWRQRNGLGAVKQSYAMRKAINKHHLAKETGVNGLDNQTDIDIYNHIVDASATGGITAMDIRDKMDMTANYIYVILRKLRHRQLIRNHHGRYFVGAEKA